MSLPTHNAMDAWSHELPSELDFWDRWLATRGLSWPDDYARRFDASTPVDPQIAGLIERLDDENVDVIDVGAGPVTRLGYVMGGKRLNITAVDALANEYDALLAKHSVSPPVRTIQCVGENLAAVFPSERFHIATAFNSLDHAYDPLAAILAMFRVVRPGGYVFLQHAKNEGQAESYVGLHQWNFDCRDGRLKLWSQSVEYDLSNLLSPHADVDVDGAGWSITVRARKHQT